MKRVLGIFSALCLVFSCAACHSEPKSQMEQDLSFLCSEECWGRLPGSTGNDAARDYIAETFEHAGLVPLQGFDSFFLPYEQITFVPELQQQTLTAFFPDGSSKIFRAGTDFYPYPSMDGGFSGETTTDPADPELAHKILLSSSASNRDCIAQVIPSEYATATIRSGHQAIFHCNTAVFEQLSGCSSLTLEGELMTEKKTLDNIAGILPGKNNKHALLVTAHFDHIGGYGDVYYPGALDNASGTALMLEILRKAAQSESTADYDLVFIAFNGEDMGELGSDSVVRQLPYQLMNVINLDCIGLEGDDFIGVMGQNQVFQENILSAFDHSFSCDVITDSFKSDHCSFESYGIPAVTISNDLNNQTTYATIHHPDDRPDKINPDFLTRVAEQLLQYIQNATLVAHYTPEIPESSGEESEEERETWKAVYQQAKVQIESIQPPYHMMVPLEINGDIYLVRDISFLANTKRAEELIPGLQFPKRLGESFLLDMEQPLGDSLYDYQDSGDRRISCRRLLPGEDYELGVLQEITDPYDETRTWTIDYRDARENERVLSLCAFDRQFDPADRVLGLSQCSSYHEIPVEGGILYQKYAHINPFEEIMTSVVYITDDLPYYYVLNNSRDNTLSMDGSELTQFMVDIIPQLREIPRLP